jgi:hypothetical protein
VGVSVCEYHPDLSSDGAATFKESTTLDLAGENKSVLGKVAVAVLDSDDVVVSWIRREGGKSQIVFSRVNTDGRTLCSQVIPEGSSDVLGYHGCSRPVLTCLFRGLEQAKQGD